jgi:hypothetical protein
MSVACEHPCCAVETSGLALSAEEARSLQMLLREVFSAGANDLLPRANAEALRNVLRRLTEVVPNEAGHA